MKRSHQPRNTANVGQGGGLGAQGYFPRTPNPEPRTNRRSLILLGLILCGGLWLRVAHLGQPSFWSDEYLHVLSAQQLINGQGPRLPSGNLYKRALPYTRAVAMSFRWFGVSETSARLPSVVFGTGLILATFLAGLRWFGFYPALFAAGLVAISPTMVAASRLCRMYSLFQLLYLGLLFAYERGLEQRGFSLWHRAAWLGIGLLFLLISVNIHPSLMLVGLVPAIAVYWAGRAIVRWRSRYSLYLLIAALVGLIGIASGIINLEEAWQRLTFAPIWSEGNRHYETFYLRKWATLFPWLWWVMPPAVLFLLIRYRALGFLIVCLFTVPFALHSGLFAWREPRFVSHLFPALALMLSPGLVWAIRALIRKRRRSLVAIGSCAAILLVLGLGAWPLKRSLALQHTSEPKAPGWREAYGFLARAAKPGEAIVASVPLAASYYLGRSATHGISTFLPMEKMTRNADGLLVDWYSGLPWVSSLEELRAIQAAYPRGWVVVDKGRLRSPRAVPEELRDYLLARCKEYPVVSNGSVRIFRWEKTRRSSQLSQATPGS